MNTDRAEQAMPVRCTRLIFDRYVLDLGRGALICEGRDIELRPKAFSVLQFLAENDRRLVSKEALFAAVWPEVTVTDDALVQVIGELRRALGEDGPRLIRTVPRRGYRFDISVAQASESEVAPGAVAASDTVASTGAVLQGEPVASHTSSGLSDLRMAIPAPFGGGLLRKERVWRRVMLAQLRALWAAVADRVRGHQHVHRLIGLCTLAMLIVAVLGSYVLPRTTEPIRSAPAPLSTGGKPTIAIVPFTFTGDAAASAYFADGVTQDLITALGRFSALTVMSWNAVARFKIKQASPGEIASALMVRYQVEGTVRRTSDRIRVSSQLVDSSGQVLWSGQFEGQSLDIFAMQDKLTSEIVKALAIRVTEAELRRAATKPPDTLETYELVLKARPALQRPTRGGIVEARSLLRRATDKEPAYAPAHAALAEAYHIDLSWGWAEVPALTAKRAEEHAARALQLNNSELGARVVLGRGHLLYDRHEQALAELDRAVEINPSDPVALAARGNILMWLGQSAAAIEALEHAQRLDPHLNAIDRFSLGLAYYLSRRFEDAAEHAALSLRDAAGSPFTLVVMAAANAQLGRRDKVASAVEAIRRQDPTFNAREFGSKLRQSTDLELLRDGLRKAGLYQD